MRSRRALLYMPGDDQYKIEKAVKLCHGWFADDYPHTTIIGKHSCGREVIV